MADLLALLAEPLRHAFLLRAVLAAIMVGAVCAVVGTFVVLRGMAFFGDALAHAVLPGVAIGYILGGNARGPLFWSGLAAALVTALAVGAITRRGELKQDTAIGIVFAGMFALGIAIISSRASFAVDLAHILFGDVLGVGPADLALTALLGGAVLAAVVLCYKEFVLISFDPVLAATLRIPSSTMHYLLLVLVAIAVVISLQTVGVALMVAMLVTPPATAFLLTRRLPWMMAIAAAIGALSSAVGLYASYYLAIASGAAIVLVCTGVFGAAFVLAPGRGWLWRARSEWGAGRPAEARQSAEARRSAEAALPAEARQSAEARRSPAAPTVDGERRLRD